MSGRALTTLFIAIPFSLFSQNNYAVSWGMGTYANLENYTVMGQFGEHIVEFGFDFPFFDEPYSFVDLDMLGAVGMLSEEGDYNLRMFEGDYSFFQNVGGALYSSRFRHEKTEIDGIKVVKVEWRDVGIDDDIFSGNVTDHRINFQFWFYENGIMELHFGLIDLANSPFYTDSTGFVWSDGESYGPWISISTPDESEVYCVSGTFGDIEIIYDPDSTDIFYGVPPEGFFIRWTPDELLQVAEPGKTEELALFPNPTTGRFFIPAMENEGPSISVLIHNLSGQLLQSLSLPNQGSFIDLSGLPDGIYLISQRGDSSVRSGKLVIRHH